MALRSPPSIKLHARAITVCHFCACRGRAVPLFGCSQPPFPTFPLLPSTIVLLTNDNHRPVPGIHPPPPLFTLSVAWNGSWLRVVACMLRCGVPQRPVARPSADRWTDTTRCVGLFVQGGVRARGCRPVRCTMLAWPFGDKVKRARRRMRRVVAKKGLAHRMVKTKKKKRGFTPPPTPKLLEGGDWEKEQWTHARMKGGDADWWLANVRLRLRCLGLLCGFQFLCDALATHTFLCAGGCRRQRQTGGGVADPWRGRGPGLPQVAAGGPNPALGHVILAPRSPCREGRGGCLAARSGGAWRVRHCCPTASARRAVSSLPRVLCRAACTRVAWGQKGSSATAICAVGTYRRPSLDCAAAVFTRLQR